jgi:hypothetical protein
VYRRFLRESKIPVYRSFERRVKLQDTEASKGE